MATNRSHTARTNTDTTSQSNTRRYGENRSNRERINHGKAQQLEIWEVARAATAAKWFFKPLEIKLPGTAGHLLFSDGGFGANNPTQEAIYELEDLYGRGSIGVVVSIGTARKDEGEAKPGFFLAVPRAAKEFASKATDPEVVHRSMESQLEEGYFRINDPGRLGIELDDWKPRRTKGKGSPRSGKVTLDEITHAFNGWAAVPSNVTYLRRCALELVHSRRQRMHHPRWECFATGARFACPERPCDFEAFLDRPTFAKHMLECHPGCPDRDVEGQDDCRTLWRYRSAPNG